MSQVRLFALWATTIQPGVLLPQGVAMKYLPYLAWFFLGPFVLWALANLAVFGYEILAHVAVFWYFILAIAVLVHLSLGWWKRRTAPKLPPRRLPVMRRPSRI